MITSKILKLLNDQIKIELDSAQIYLSMHAWAADYGLEGTAKFLLQQYHEEVSHALKFINFISDKDERALVCEVEKPEQDFGNMKTCFETLLDHEMFVAESIHNIVNEARDAGELPVEIFMNWYVMEQIEEEAMALRILDKIKLAGDNKAAILEVDDFIGSIRK